MLFGLIVVCLMASSLFAISGATTSGISQLRWTTAVTAGTAPTQGGNITGVNIASTQLTSKWASFNGNVSGTIRLSDTEAGSAVYVWTYSAANGGQVCASTGSTFSASAPVNATTAGMDSAFTTSSAPDNAAGTFNTTCPTLALSTGALTNFLASKTQANSTFTTCAMTAGGTANVNHAFCTNTNSSGKNYNNGNANFELIVPSTGTGANGGTYYFFMELD